MKGSSKGGDEHAVILRASRTVSLHPAFEHISTSHVERSNLTCRMQMRFTRLTNGVSKKLENIRHNVALHFTHYNFCRVHQSLRVTPVMESKLSVWEVEELVGLLEADEAKMIANGAMKRGSYQKKTK